MSDDGGYDDRCAAAQEAAQQVFPPAVGRLVRARIIALRIVAGPSDRLRAELDALVADVEKVRSRLQARCDHIQAYLDEIVVEWDDGLECCRVSRRVRDV